MQSTDETLAARAIPLWGYAVGSLPEEHSYLTQAVDWLVERFRSGPWSASVACVEALGGIGGTRALDALGRTGMDPKADARLKYFVIRALGQAGKDALPHLFRLCFDEVETGNSVNAHRLRACDEAAKEVDRLLGYRFGYEEAVAYAERRGPALEAIRAEARRRGYEP